MNRFSLFLIALLTATGSCGCTTLSSLKRDLAEQPPRRKERQENVVAAFEAKRDAAQLQAALTRWNEGNHAACEQLLTGLVQRKPQLVEARLQLAELHLFRGEMEPAEQQLRAALAIAPQRADLHDCLARVLEASSRTEEALTHFQKAAELEPGSDLYRLAAAPLR